MGARHVTVRDSGVRVLTDPLFARRLAHLRRRRGRVPPPRRPRADVVLVSHLHADHLHVAVAGAARRPAPGAAAARRPRGGAGAAPGTRPAAADGGRGRATSLEFGDADGTGRAGRARRAAAAVRAAAGAARSATWCEGEARTYFAGDTGLFDGDGRGGRAGATWRCCRSAAGARILGPRPSGRGAGGPGAGPAGAARRGAGALRHVLADRDGRGAAARVPRAGRGVRAARGASCAPEVAVHRLEHGRERAAGGAGRETPGDRLPGSAAATSAAVGEHPAGGRLSVAVPAGGARGAGAGGADGGAGEFGAAVVAFHQTDAVRAARGVRAWRRSPRSSGTSALYWLGRRGVRSQNGSRWLEAIQGRAPRGPLAQAQRKLDEHGAAVLVLSRLVPAGRIPVMLACLLAEMPMRRFARGDVPACLAWAATYQLIGILGGSLFPEPWQGVVAGGRA